MKIDRIDIREIFDSRGESTIEITVTNDRGESASAQVPSGKSRGKNEAEVFSFIKAKEVLEGTVRKILEKKSFNAIQVLDQTLLTADGTARKEKLGGNVILGLSVAFARLLASERKQPLWKTVEDAFFEASAPVVSPLIFSNFVNGGAHAQNTLDIQEYLVVAKPGGTMADAVKRLVALYNDFADVLRKAYDVRAIPVGDEEGFSLNFKNNFEPLELLGKLIVKKKAAETFSLALDVAATGFFKKGTYRFDGKELGADEMIAVYKEYKKRSKLLMSIEDPFAEDDLDGFRKAGKILKGVWIVGDDLTTTFSTRIEKYAREGLINAAVIKPNQIGTITESAEAMHAAHSAGAKCIISHRSGETEDPFIMHLARAGRAEAVKIGAPLNERIVKYNELVRIYD